MNTDLLFNPENSFARADKAGIQPQPGHAPAAGGINSQNQFLNVLVTAVRMAKQPQTPGKPSADVTPAGATESGAPADQPLQTPGEGFELRSPQASDPSNAFDIGEPILTLETGDLQPESNLLAALVPGESTADHFELGGPSEEDTADSVVLAPRSNIGAGVGRFGPESSRQTGVSVPGLLQTETGSAGGPGARHPDPVHNGPAQREADGYGLAGMNRIEQSAERQANLTIENLHPTAGDSAATIDSQASGNPTGTGASGMILASDAKRPAADGPVAFDRKENAGPDEHRQTLSHEPAAAGQNSSQTAGHSVEEHVDPDNARKQERDPEQHRPLASTGIQDHRMTGRSDSGTIYKERHFLPGSSGNPPQAASDTPSQTENRAAPYAGQAQTATEAPERVGDIENRLVPENAAGRKAVPLQAAREGIHSEIQAGTDTKSGGEKQAHTDGDKAAYNQHAANRAFGIQPGKPEGFAEGLDDGMREGVNPGGSGSARVQDDRILFNMASKDSAADAVSRQAETAEPQAESRQLSAEAEKFSRVMRLNQIVDKAALQFRQGVSEVQIDLKPEYLGRVRMQIAAQNNQVTVKIMAELPAVREIIESNLAQLKTELQNQQVQVDRLDVSVFSGSEHSQRRWRQAGHSKSGKQTAMETLEDNLAADQQAGVNGWPADGKRSENEINFFA